MNNQFDKSLESKFDEIFKNFSIRLPIEMQKVNDDVMRTGTGFYRVDEDLKITRIRKGDVEIQPIANLGE